MYGIGLRLNDNTTFSQKLQESLPQGTSAKRPKWPTQSQFIQHSSKVIVQIHSSQSILPANFSTVVGQSVFPSQFLTQINKLLKEKSNNYYRFHGMGSNLQFPPLSLNSVLIKNNILIPQGFALRPAVSLAPSLKEIATPDESA